MICPHCGHEIPGVTVRPTPLQFVGPTTITASTPFPASPTVATGAHPLHFRWTMDANGNWIAQAPAAPTVIDSTLQDTQEEQAHDEN